MPIRSLKSNILRESYGHFTKTVILSFPLRFFFCDKNFDRIKSDGHYGLKLKTFVFSLNMAKLGHIIYQNLWKCRLGSNGGVCFYPGGHFCKLPPKALI